MEDCTEILQLSPPMCIPSMSDMPVLLGLAAAVEEGPVIVMVMESIV